jgi:hypothetical protein
MYVWMDVKDAWMDECMYVFIDGWMYGHMSVCTYVCTYVWKDGCIDVWMEGRLD